jgi:uncharacterized protein YbaR (Trm112 family)
MRQELMEILACPVCKGELSLTVVMMEGDEVITGSLHCPNCNEDYPIEDGIPNLLPPDMRRAMAAEAGRA